jgi:Phosphorylated CTD interacting factor 1 WW domain
MEVAICGTIIGVMLHANLAKKSAEVRPNGTRNGAADSAPSTNDGELEREYRRYTFILQILQKMYVYTARACAKPRKIVEYEVRNIVERWLLTLANFTADTAPRFDEIFSRDASDVSSPANQQFAYEMAEKFATPREAFATFFRAEIVGLVQQFADVHDRPCADRVYRLEPQSGLFHYGAYTRTLAPARLALLVDRGGKRAVARMLLRYACILPGAQHWNMPLASFRDYCAEGLTVEGFASPVNAQMILLDKSNHFCSLFSDVDAPFGSIGGFFETDFVGRRASVGPPYTVELFKKIADKVESQCVAAVAARREVLFYVTFSAWEDTEGFQQILRSKWCYFAAILPAYEHFYANTNDPAEPKVIAKFSTVFFVVGTPGDCRATTQKYELLFDGMAVNAHVRLKILKDMRRAE